TKEKQAPSHLLGIDSCRFAFSHDIYRFGNQIGRNEFAPFRRILAHVIGQYFLDLHSLRDLDLFKADVFTNETSEFVGRDFTEALESGNLGMSAQFFYGILPRLQGVAIECPFHVSGPEERYVETVEM